jgi:1-aminocyclopropane-1-carboxylate deaminase
MYNLPPALADVLTLPSPLESMTLDGSLARIWCKRDDLIHPIISGNKWRKLSQTITALGHRRVTQDSVHLISFGGGHSNHLHALAYTCFVLGYEFTAIVRGHYTGNETPCLQDLAAWSSHIIYTDKSQYKRYTDPSHPEHQASIQALQTSYPNAIILPEGGYSVDALAGSAMCMTEIATQLPQAYDQYSAVPQKVLVVSPVATGATLAGLVAAKYCDVLGIAVLKGQGYLEDNVCELLCDEHHDRDNTWWINHDYVTRGYAKSSPVLDGFITSWNAANPTLLVESCYSGKALWGLSELVKSGHLKHYTDIVFLHTGGLQATRNLSTNSIDKK